MNTQIIDVLHTTCQNHTITPLHAIESGSRAWGFASPDSDYDVRLVYHHHPDWYLQIYHGKDTFEFINHQLFDVPFDIGGWDIKKVLTHIHKSNAVIFEWINSPIVYHSNSDFIQSIKSIQYDFFNPQSVYHHYQGLAKKSMLDLDLNSPIKLKKWCYLIRALLASLWIDDYQSIPPVLMSEMFILLDKHDTNQIKEVLTIKQSYDENHLYQLSPSLQKFTISLYQNTQNMIFTQKPKGDVDVLDKLFRKTVFNI
ncbi:nucleotidyltransferase domain-containing protein [Moraxella oblonga]|uniref:nucleotidyltransferase domain-containing protein n=1 Tax=Moraxella oblonga TaxID=200413 RepID=UPI00082A5321|nr:nucleotidyltransferase domain-containing protein [Moraxella oblonga]